jgi:hypothetical protein
MHFPTFDLLANCDASGLLPNAEGPGDCTDELPSGESCENTELSGFTCTPTLCFDGDLTLGRCYQQTAITDSNIGAAADGWSDNIDPADGYGPIVDWDVSAITNMEQGAL